MVGMVGMVHSRGVAPRDNTGTSLSCAPPPYTHTLPTPPPGATRPPAATASAACLQYFLEILQNRKSDTLEWIIIVLIGAEICLSLYDLASKGLGGAS